MLEHFNDNCAKYLTTTLHMSLNETLYPTRSQIGFKQYNHDKPAKYGILVKSLNSAGSPNLYKTNFYASKPEGIPNEYYLKRTANFVKSLVNGLSNFLKLQSFTEYSKLTLVFQ